MTFRWLADSASVAARLGLYLGSLTFAMIAAGPRLAAFRVGISANAAALPKWKS